MKNKQTKKRDFGTLRCLIYMCKQMKTKLGLLLLRNLLCHNVTFFIAVEIYLSRVLARAWTTLTVMSVNLMLHSSCKKVAKCPNQSYSKRHLPTQPKSKDTSPRAYDVIWSVLTNPFHGPGLERSLT